MGQPGDFPGLRRLIHPWLGSLLCLWLAGRSAGGWTVWDALIHTPVDQQVVDQHIHQRSGLPSTTFFFAILVLRGSHHESAREETVKFCFSVSPICTHNAQDPSYFASQYKIFIFFNLISGSHCVGSLSSDQMQTSSQNSVTYLKILFFSSFC